MEDQAQQGDHTPMPSPGTEPLAELPPASEGTDLTAQSAMIEVKNENGNQTTALKPDELTVEFFIGEARKNSSNLPPSGLADNSPAIPNDFNSFKRKFIEFHNHAVMMSGNEDISLELNLAEADVQTLIGRFNSGLYHTYCYLLVIYLFVFIAVFSMQKSPIQIMNELYPGGQKVRIVDKGSFGPPHEPLHITCAHIENIGNFLGKAKSKQDSKQFAAKLAISFLKELITQYQQSGVFTPAPNKPTPNIPNSNKSNKKTRYSKSINGNADNNSSSINSDNNNSTNDNSETVVSMEADEANVSSDNIQVKDVPSIEEKIDINQNNSTPKDKLLDNEIAKLIYDAIIEKSRIFGPDIISQLVQSSGNKVNDNTQDFWRFKEIAGFVVVSDIDQSVQVLSLSTGTKCVSSEFLSLNGDVLQDCHAEILARRGLLCVLYEHLQALLDNQLKGTCSVHIVHLLPLRSFVPVDKPEFILEPREGGNGFRLKKDLKLHLYISSPPCGDARIFNFAVSVWQ